MVAMWYTEGTMSSEDGIGGPAWFGSVLIVLVGIWILLLSLLSATGFARASEYYLPYPGILPDSPFYKVKMVRDWVSLRLTFDKDAKAQKELLFANKRINAAKSLYEGGKKELAISVATKAKKYLQQAAKDGADVRAAILKHDEILMELNLPLTPRQ